MNKVKQIIAREFDLRMAGAVVTYIIQKGWDNVAETTDEQIEQVEGNSIMTKSFVQAFVEVARKVARECNLVNDFLPFIQEETNVTGRVHVIDLYREDMESMAWEQICYQLDLDEETQEITGQIILDM